MKATQILVSRTRVATDDVGYKQDIGRPLSITSHSNRPALESRPVAHRYGVGTGVISV